MMMMTTMMMMMMMMMAVVMVMMVMVVTVIIPITLHSWYPSDLFKYCIDAPTCVDGSHMPS